MTLSDDKKKTIYIGLIIFCLVTTGSIIFISMKKPGAPAPEPAEITPAVQNSAPQVQSSGIGNQLKLLKDSNYPAPSVFPTQPQFDVSVFQSPAFLSLNSQELPIPQPNEFGNEPNPFRSVIKKK